MWRALIGQRRSRPYESSAHLEDDETFLLTVDQLPTRPPPRARGRRRIEIPDAPGHQIDPGAQQTEAADVSQLVDLLGDPGSLGRLAAYDVRPVTGSSSS